VAVIAVAAEEAHAWAAEVAAASAWVAAADKFAPRLRAAALRCGPRRLALKCILRQRVDKFVLPEWASKLMLLA
jgi:hypothetical protein